MQLPFSKPRPAIQTFNGAAYSFSLDKELTAKLRALANSQQTTLYTVLLAAYQVLLFRYTGRGEMVIGSPISARMRAEFEGIIGCFFNAIILRANLSGEDAFTEVLRQVRRKALEALEHQEYPSQLLAERLQADRDPSRPPLFQVNFILQKPPQLANHTRLAVDNGDSIIEIGSLRLKLVPIEKRHARVDLELEMVEAEDCLTAWFQYNVDLFDASSIAGLASHFKNLLSGIVADPLRKISFLPLLSECERQKIISEWSNTGEDYSKPVTIFELFDAQARKTPDSAAAVHGDDCRTYGQLRDQAKRLGSFLKELKND
jgi:non-ribosomal peptide synthetase component F